MPCSYPPGRRPRLPDPGCHLRVRRSCLRSTTNNTAPSLGGSVGTFTSSVCDPGLASLVPEGVTHRSISPVPSKAHCERRETGFWPKLLPV